MFQTQLKTLGLTNTQSKILDTLLEHGEKKARDIAKTIRQPRGAVYKVLEELIDLSLVNKVERDKKITTFRAEHPRNLEQIIKQKEFILNQKKKLLEEILPGIISNYNLTLNKPGIRFYEGESGLNKVLEDTLTSKTDILQMINIHALKNETAFRQINEDYKYKRKRKEIKKKIIRIDKKPELTFGTADDKYDSITEIRYIDKNFFDSKASIQIYDNKISYQMADGDDLISILIENKQIYEMNKAWFEMLWEIAKT